VESPPLQGRRPEGPEGETVPPGLPPIPVVAVPVWAVAVMLLLTVILNVANYISTDNDLQQTLTLIYENQGTDPGQCLLADRRDMPDEPFVHQIIENIDKLRRHCRDRQLEKRLRYRCGSEQLIAFVYKITYVHYRADPRRAEDRGQFMSCS